LERVSVKYVLDTHAAIWLLEGNAKLGARARAALEQEERESVALAGISLLEIAMLAARNVIALTPNAQTGLRVFADKLTVLPIDSSIAADAVTLALPQRDPFDRVITATARAHDLVLITKDRRITKAKVVSTLW